MSKKEKRGLLILILVVGVLVTIMLVSINKKNKTNIASGQVGNNVVNEENYVEVLDDGTKLNVSDKIKETKTIEGLEISNVQITEKNNLTQILGTVRNTLSVKQEGFLANLSIVNSKGEELTKVQVYIGPLEPGASRQLNTMAVFDYTNAYDLKISRAS